MLESPITQCDIDYKTEFVLGNGTKIRITRDAQSGYQKSIEYRWTTECGNQYNNSGRRHHHGRKGSGCDIAGRIKTATPEKNCMEQVKVLDKCDSFVEDSTQIVVVKEWQIFSISRSIYVKLSENMCICVRSPTVPTPYFTSVASSAMVVLRPELSLTMVLEKKCE